MIAPKFKINFTLILLVGILLSGIFVLSYGHSISLSSLVNIGHGLVMTAGLWVGCMYIVMFLWRKYPWEQKPLKHLLLEISMILPYTIIFPGGLYILETSLKILPPSEHIMPEAFTTILITFLITSIYESLYFYRQWKYNFSRSVRLEKDNIEARYEALKTQLNPHFLFNSLNSLTTMVDDNKKAVEYITNLSDFLRYMLGSQDKELVMVRDEINLLKKYISLQQTRYKKALAVEVDVPEKYYHFAIPPLVLQMLVENCIKHNILSKDKPLRITIRAEEGCISVENNLQKKTDVTSTGQGLKNITQRYRFFTSDQVKITKTTSIFKVSIPLLTVEL